MGEVQALAKLDEPEIAQVVALVDAAARADGVGPLSEHSLLALRGGGPGFTVSDGGSVVAYARLDPATDDESASGELVVHPGHRRRGHGRALLRALLREAGGPLRVWAHGDLPAAAKLASSEGLDRVRALFQMRRPAAEPLPPVQIADGVRVRPFEVGRDEQAWLEVNARAFADHPEQGAWTIDDLRGREAEDWFDPEGFFLAERTTVEPGRLVGFHWTKIHPDGLGEVYVVGVDPSAQGLGLGRTLTLTGLHHLRDRGVPQILLYVDESNTSAARLYESLGFTRHAVDVMYGPAPRP
ncbi:MULTISPECIES: mycothiol synthase [Actinomadura]|uniref:Mycothiol acetyltransferase n=1 Tax=Actinomadura yumaensis TaxID=111807 RepID=A0ABW2CFC1_9ACTN|nr:mycothiol synthase [Actinomadura sp. J1-007]MWK34554.1 mycothiol synthase [Actinomadura sp. J1-007]